MASRAGDLPLSFIPSPSIQGFHIGALDIHFYGLMYVVGITLAVIIARRRWQAMGGNPDLIYDIAYWVVPAGIVGGRIYFDITTPADITPHTWWGVFAVWDGGLGIWGGVAAGVLAGIWRCRRAGVSPGMLANALAPSLLVAQAIGRIGNYFNSELFGKPSTLPWALEISLAHRPAGYLSYATFQPSFLYELIFDLAWAGVLVVVARRYEFKPWALFALYVAGYSGYRIFEETIRIDSSEHFLGLRLNFYIATIMTIVGLVWLFFAQRGEAAAGVTSPAAEGGDPAAAGLEPAAGHAAGGSPDQ